MNTNEMVLGELDPIDKRIKQSETESIEARWEFGKLLRKQIVGKQLPRGLRSQITERFGVENSEITRRMQLAEKFTTRDELAAACEKCGGAWRRIIREELVEASQKSSAGWGKRAKWRLDKLMHEAVTPEQRRNLAEVLDAALARLTAETVEVAA